MSYAALVAMLAAGCESVEERMAKTASSKPEERLDALGAIEEFLDEEEAERAENGGGLSPEGQAHLAAAAALAAKDPDPQVRATALALLGRSPSWTDVAFFRNALADPAWRCAYEALHALRVRHDRESLPAVIALLEHSPELLIRLEAIESIREAKAREAIPVLVGIVTNLLERNQTATAAWLALTELTGQHFSSENFLAWEEWYKASKGADQKEKSQDNVPGVPSTPAAGKGSAGGEPSANK
jgi:hypothetical protein